MKIRHLAEKNMFFAKHPNKEKASCWLWRLRSHDHTCSRSI